MRPCCWRCCWCPPPPPRKHSIAIGFADPDFHRGPDERSFLMDEARSVGAGYVREVLSWNRIALTKPADPTDPKDPAYDFRKLDLIVRAAAARGMRVLFTIHAAPSWAEGAPLPGSPPPQKDNGGYRPKASALADFATALATRYSGSFVPDPAPSDPVPTALPRVSHVEPWNEPNLTGFLSPQWYDGKPYSIDMYRHLLNVVYKAYKAVQPHATVIAGGTGPDGETVESRHISPLMFFRELLCLTKKLKAAKCPVKARFDVLSHHPISPTTSPYRHAFGTDNATVPDMKKVKRILRAAERHHTTLPSGEHNRPLWATEFWWESNPPTQVYPAPNLRKQAVYTEQALRLLWQQGIPVALLFQVHDSPVLAGPPRVGWATGMLYNDDQPKPSYTAVHFPFVAERKSHKRIALWARSPAAGKVRIISIRHGQRKRVATLPAGAGGVVHRRIRLRGKTHMVARVGSDESLKMRVPKKPGG